MLKVLLLALQVGHQHPGLGSLILPCVTGWSGRTAAEHLLGELSWAEAGAGRTALLLLSVGIAHPTVIPTSGETRVFLTVQVTVFLHLIVAEIESEIHGIVGET